MSLTNGWKSLAATVALAVMTPMAAAQPVTQPVKAPGGQVPLIDREILFGNPERAAVRISPDGQYLSWVAPVDGVLNVWVAPVDDLDAARPVTNDRKRGITTYFWAYDNRHLLYLQDEGGNENRNVFSVDLQTNEVKNLVNNPNVAAQIEAVSEEFPGKILIGMNERNPMFHDVYEVDIATGERELVLEHPQQIEGNIVAGLGFDHEFHPRLATAFTADGGQKVYTYEPETNDGPWRPFMTIDFADTMTTGINGLRTDGDTAYLADSRGRDTAALYEIKLSEGPDKKKLIAEHDLADVGGVLQDPLTKEVQAVNFNYLKSEWKVVDANIEEDVDRLRELAGDGEWGVTARSLDDRRWIVYTSSADGPVKYYLYERGHDNVDGQSITYLFSNQPKLEDLPLVPMHPVIIRARDGLELPSYLTLPAGTYTKTGDDSMPSVLKVNEPLPLVLDVHGGPWARDSYGYNPIHQWLANRGYAVLSVNFRGSTGFGKTHVNAANLEWGAKMHTDLLDAVNWAIEQGIADPERVAITGGSYGGYATLWAMTHSPDVFAAGVDIVGPSNLNTLLATIPPYWAPAVKLFHTRVGDPTSEEGKKFLESRSPLSYVDQIKKPLLIGQGANDPRVKQAESDQIVKAMQEKDIPVTYVLYPDEGHGFARPENRLSFFGVQEAFLAEHLGGRHQPLTPEDFEGSSIQVPAGAEEIPGLQAAMK